MEASRAEEAAKQAMEDVVRVVTRVGDQCPELVPPQVLRGLRELGNDVTNLDLAKLRKVIMEAPT